MCVSIDCLPEQQAAELKLSQTMYQKVEHDVALRPAKSLSDRSYNTFSFWSLASNRALSLVYLIPKSTAPFKQERALQRYNISRRVYADIVTEAWRPIFSYKSHVSGVREIDNTRNLDFQPCRPCREAVRK